MRKQRTIGRNVELAGPGLFTGEKAVMRVRPAEPHTGITFVRMDQAPPIRVSAVVENISKRARRTSLRNGTVAIETVEHWLSACAGLGIDNLEIELSGPEVPGLDGSAKPFVEMLQSAGICEQDAAREPLVISEVIRVADGGAEVLALPPLGPEGDTLEVSYSLDYGQDNPIGRQDYRVVITPDSFATDIAPARTFILEEEARQLQAAGLARHLSPKDVLVYAKNGPIDNEVRFPEECARHKILDLLGDLMLLGRFLVGRVYARRSGHSLNHALVRALLEQGREQQQASYVSRDPRIDIRSVQRILPHRYPLLMIDRIIEIDGSKRVVGLKNVTINEEFFQGHYPGDPIMPGVLIIEALAQIGGILLSQVLEHKGKVAVLLSLDKVKFRHAVRPGDQLILEAETIRVRSRTGHVMGRAKVAGQVVAEAEIRFGLTDAESH